MRQLQLQNTLDLIYPAGSVFSRTVGRADQWIPAGPVADDLDAALALQRQIQSRPDSHDLVWPPIWVQVDREPWEEVERELTAEDEYDREAWELDYPHATEWLGVTIRQSEHLWYLHHAQMPASFSYDPAGRQVSGFLVSDETEVVAALHTYLSWMSRSLQERLTQFLADPKGYNAFVKANLPNHERIGRIRRTDLWRALPAEQHFLCDELREEEINEFVRLAPTLVDVKPLSGLTRDDYLRFCAICYAGAGYESVQGLSPLAQYQKLADGRHDGLLDLPGDDPAALAAWFDSRLYGGHPWEIARGGNTTHISLFLSKQGSDYTLFLEGSARSRAAETIRMALALAQASIPFSLHDAAYLAKMAQGQDWIGIVPRDADSYAAATYFPPEDEVRDVLVYAAITQHTEVEQWGHWYSVEPLHRVNKIQSPTQRS